MEKGTRVIAFLSTTKDEVRLLGSGIYEGDEIPPEDIGGFNWNIPCPKIVLNNGTVVWGCECWWGTETQGQALLAKYSISQITVVNMEEERKRYGEKNSKDSGEE